MSYRLSDIIWWEPGMPLPAPPEALLAGQGMCCTGSANGTPLDCTCWEPVWDLGQQPVQPGLPRPADPPRMCGDCAYRPGSPERAGEPSHQGDRELLDNLVDNGAPFFCHAGMRRPVKWVHPSGAEIPGHAANYRPPIRDGVPYKADGTPGDICSGWFLRRAHQARQDDASLERTGAL